MRPLIPQEFLLARGSAAPEDLLASLRARFEIAETETEESRQIFWDTFDWRLFKAGLQLVERPGGGGRELVWGGESGEPRGRLELPASFEGGLAEDLPEELRALAKPLSMRRLLPILRVRTAGSRIRVLGEESKTVARLRVLRAFAARDASSPEHALVPRLLVEPVRGYRAEEAAVLDHLGSACQLERPAASLFEAALEALGRRPGDYSSKVALVLEPGQSALDTACSIYRALLDAMVVNEPGMRQDLDSEFLHDFRVAVRRTRSALSQIRGVFAEDVLLHFKQEFAWLGGITGPTRDLDVYRLKIPVYRRELPDEAARDLEPLETFLARRQKQEQRRLVEALDTERYRDLLETWSRQIQNPAAGPAAESPALELASARIWRLYRRIRKRGLAIDDDTPAAALHEVRIMGKKLRYLLEFFRSLYPQGPVGSAIRELKRLQDNLGDFNDYEVQQLALQGFAEDLLKAEGGDPA
ncbi:MAG: CHAD domain-containing protein, partial [Acidobacteriota bacterium]